MKKRAARVTEDSLAKAGESLTPQAWPVRTFVEVTWIDSCTRSAWEHVNVYQHTKPVVCKTAGYLFEDTPTYITVVLSQTEEGDLNASMTIPKAVVTAIRRFE